LATIPAQQLRRVGLLLGLIVCGLFIAHTINAFVADALYLIPDPPPGSGAVGSTGAPSLTSYSSQQAVEQIQSSGLFLLPPMTGDRTTDATSSDRRGGSGPVVRASLGLAGKLRLIGVVLGDQRGVFAIIEDLSSKQQSLYHLHDSVLDLGEVSEIRRNGVIIRQGNLEELLELAHAEGPSAAVNPAGTSLPPKKPSTSSAPLRKVVDRREVEQAMSDLPKLLSQARAVPNMANGAVNGYRLDYIAPASFYEKIGVQTGDVLQRVNGVDIRDPSTMLSLLQQLKNEQIVKLDVVRNNQRSTITYELR
jgi:general secretion pathway protein C